MYGIEKGIQKWELSLKSKNKQDNDLTPGVFKILWTIKITSSFVLLYKVVRVTYLLENIS